jgi:hypothetical protein
VRWVATHTGPSCRESARNHSRALSYTSGPQLISVLTAGVMGPNSRPRRPGMDFARFTRSRSRRY